MGDRDKLSIVLGTVGGTVGGAIAGLAASGSQQQPQNGSNGKDYTELLKKLDLVSASLQSIYHIVEMQTRSDFLQFDIDQRSYLSRKVHAGEAFTIQSSFFSPVAGLGTVTFNFTNAEGYVLVFHQTSFRFSQQGIISLTAFSDNLPTPWVFMPRTHDFDIQWSIVPYIFIIKTSESIIFQNFDTNPQWILSGNLGTFIRKDVWERDIAEINKEAQQYDSLRRLLVG